MQFPKKKYSEDDDSISLLTYLLVRYPELGTINYSPRGHILKMSFILADDLDKGLFQDFCDELTSCISSFFYFEKQEEPRIVRITRSLGPGISIIEITRDAATLSQKEIALIVSYLHEKFVNILVSDANYYHEDELLEQDDYIRYMLDSIKIKNPKTKLIGVREEGRVLVFKR